MYVNQQEEVCFERRLCFAVLSTIVYSRSLFKDDVYTYYLMFLDGRFCGMLGRVSLAACDGDR